MWCTDRTVRVMKKGRGGGMYRGDNSYLSATYRSWKYRPCQSEMYVNLYSACPGSPSPHRNRKPTFLITWQMSQARLTIIYWRALYSTLIPLHRAIVKTTTSFDSSMFQATSISHTLTFCFRNILRCFIWHNTLRYRDPVLWSILEYYS